MIAAPANPQLLPATRTVQQPIGLDDTHHFSRRPSTGQRTVIASCSKQRENAYGGDRYNDHHADSRKARGGYLGPSPFRRHTSPIAPCPRQETPVALRLPPFPAAKTLGPPPPEWQSHLAKNSGAYPRSSPDSGGS
jgi:hypothetical protein